MQIIDSFEIEKQIFNCHFRSCNHSGNSAEKLVFGGASSGTDVAELPKQTATVFRE